MHEGYHGVLAELVVFKAQRGGDGPADESRLSAPARRILKASIPGATLADPAWAAALAADLRGTAEAFLEGIGDRSGFASFYDQSVLTKAPLRTWVVSETSNLAADIVAEGAPKPVAKLAFNGGLLEPSKLALIIVMNGELVAQMSAAAQAFVSRALRRAVARGLDPAFVAALADAGGVVDVTTTDDMKRDLKALMDACPATRPGWIAARDVAGMLALSITSDPPPMTGSGELLGAPFVVSDGLAAGTLALVDGDNVASAIQGISVDVGRDASLQMADAPAAGAAPLTSMFQTNSVALRSELTFGARPGSANAAAVMTGIAWGATP